MADELSFTFSFVYAGKTNKSKGFTIDELTLALDQTGSHYTRGTQIVGSTTEAIGAGGDISTWGICFFFNMNANTGVLKLGLSGVNDTTDVVRIEPGGDFPAIFRASGPVYGFSSDQSVQVDFIVIEA